MTKNNKLDQFYTKDVIAKECVKFFENNVCKIDIFSCVVEPSAGSGNILNYLPKNTIALDLAPNSKNIIKKDYLKYKPITSDNILVFGNPPFGKNASLAIKFFNHSAKFANYIAFILPRTFRKFSIINRLDSNFHLVKEWILPINSFETPDGNEYSVPTVFQIWQKKSSDREKFYLKNCNPIDWTWTKNIEEATHAIRRVGVNAGKIYNNPLETSKQSHYYLISHSCEIEKKFNFIYSKYWEKETTPNSKWDVAGNPSLSKQEICCLYNSDDSN